MKIQTIPNINFKSDYYGFKKTYDDYNLISIKTDDPPEENKGLLLSMHRKGVIHTKLPMIYDGKYYTCDSEVLLFVTDYEILNKKDKSGKKEFNRSEYAMKLNLYDRLSTGRGLEKVLVKGSAKGLLVTDLNNIPQDKPVILMIDKPKAAYKTISTLDINVQGLILNKGEIGSFTHTASLAGKYFNFASIVYDDKKYDEIKKMAGESLEISNKSGKLEYQKIDKLPELAEFKPPTPKIPILDEETKLLDFSELTRKNSGEKAYRLGIMQKLIKEDYLQDIEVPAGFVIPLGYINKIYEYINQTENELERTGRVLYHPMNNELANACRLYGIEEDSTILRSAFNAEDLPDYPTAGIYRSMDINDCYKNFVIGIDSIVESKNLKAAINSRKRYGLESAIIQPTIIVQRYIQPDYTFTLYTDSYDGTLKIETYERFAEHKITPTTISYDKESGELKIEDLPYAHGKYVIKDTGEVVEQHLEQDTIEKKLGISD